MKHDICIVGGGIAGSALAYKLSSEFKVCVVEKSDLRQVGKKPCPGAVERSWFRGFSPEEFGAVSLRIRRMRLWVGGMDLRVKFDGYVLDRHRFCRGLLTAAVANGCELVKGRAEVNFNGGISYVIAGKERIDAEFYVDASGASAVMRRFYLPNEPGMFSLGCMETVDEPNEGEELSVYLLNQRETGWVFPAARSTNVGFVVHGFCGTCFEGKLRELKRKIGMADAKVLEKGYRLIPSYRPIPMVYDNLVAIGDAGITVNPITCGGIGPSIFAADKLAESLRTGKGLRAFEAEYWEKLGRKFEKFYHINRLLRMGWIPIRLAVRAYYSDGWLGRLSKQLLRL